MSGLGEIVSTVFATATIVAAILAGLAYGRTRTLRAAIDDRDKRIEGLEGRIDDTEADLIRTRATLTQAQTEAAVLSRVITGEAHWIAIEHQLDEHHKAAMAGVDRIVTAIERARG